jgi:hypothetical protein
MSVCVDPKRPHPGLILSHLWVTQRPSALMEAAEPQRPPKPALAQLTSAVGLLKLMLPSRNRPKLVKL